jgi:tetratricopeptide (TPR) repeat protein
MFLPILARHVLGAGLRRGYGDLARGDRHIIRRRAALASALLANGKSDEAQQTFAIGLRLSQTLKQDRKNLYLLEDPTYCDLLFAKHDWAAARDRAVILFEYAQENSWPLIMGYSSLTLARAHLGLALTNIHSSNTSEAVRADALVARARHDKAIDCLKASGQAQFLPSGLLARAAFRRSIGDWNGASRDLDEVEEIAEPGPMKLYLCDVALERARLAFAQIEAFAPLNGMLEKDNPDKPKILGAAEIAGLKKVAADQLDKAADYIKTCGYHRRDEELAELQAVRDSKRKFAALPPRV